MSQNDIDYFRHERKSLSINIPRGNHRVLDVGCGAGYFGAYLKKSGQAAKVFGIEIFKDAADEASTHLDGVICADIDTLDLSTLRNKWGDHAFDFIECADVLEHVKNPWSTLAALYELLGTGGKLIVSLPNVRHWSVLFPLLFRGRWDYRDAGIMDRTHLRFFTRSTACEMLQGAGFHLTSIQPLIGGRWRVLSKVSGRLLDGFLAIQWILVAHRGE